MRGDCELGEDVRRRCAMVRRMGRASGAGFRHRSYAIRFKGYVRDAWGCEFAGFGDLVCFPGCP